MLALVFLQFRLRQKSIHKIPDNAMFQTRFDFITSYQEWTASGAIVVQQSVGTTLFYACPVPQAILTEYGCKLLQLYNTQGYLAPEFTLCAGQEGVFAQDAEEAGEVGETLSAPIDVADVTLPVTVQQQIDNFEFDSTLRAKCTSGFCPEETISVALFQTYQRVIAERNTDHQVFGQPFLRAIGPFARREGSTGLQRAPPAFPFRFGEGPTFANWCVLGRIGVRRRHHAAAVGEQ